MFTFIVAVYIIMLLIITLPVLLICQIIRKNNRALSNKIASVVAQIWAKGSLFFGGVRVEVIGVENVPKEPVLFVGNHRSLYDIPAFYAKAPKHAGFIAKLEMRKIPIMSTWMKNMECLFLDRENIREGLKTILEGIEYIKNGGSLFICPEGTRNHKEQTGEFKEGSLKLAQKSGCPVIPVAFIGTDDRFENRKFGVTPGKCKIVFGEPIYLDQLEPEYKKMAGQYVRNEIQKLIEEYK